MPVRPASATVNGYGSLAPILEKKRGFLVSPQKARYQNAKARIVEDGISTVGLSPRVCGKLITGKVRKSLSKVKKKSNFEVMAEQDQKVAAVLGDKGVDTVLLHQTDFRMNVKRMNSGDPSADGGKDEEKKFFSKIGRSKK